MIKINLFKKKPGTIVSLVEAFISFFEKYLMYCMFQNTLSLLSRQIIQQFLDELVWRERWGYIPARAFENMIAHLAEQTKLDTG